MTVAGYNGQRGGTRKVSPGVWRESCAFRLKWCKRACPRAVMRRGSIPYAFIFHKPKPILPITRRETCYAFLLSVT